MCEQFKLSLFRVDGERRDVERLMVFGQKSLVNGCWQREGIWVYGVDTTGQQCEVTKVKVFSDHLLSLGLATRTHGTYTVVSRVTRTSVLLISWVAAMIAMLCVVDAWVRYIDACMLAMHWYMSVMSDATNATYYVACIYYAVSLPTVSLLGNPYRSSSKIVNNDICFLAESSSHQP